ncbi:phage protein NinX family protein [Citrobacter portucalensis]|uniref:phage protein NinX family protein n=1 Tax=Citrobacter portucalensis TaxID=1639133 RepID=UPI000C223B42|nr:phage protein NinX family protein [Citrobacter portucalensis]ATX92332.1 protein ninX [Citrobacter freundii]AVD78714.1 protein ninX [Citrobacter freundii]
MDYSKLSNFEINKRVADIAMNGTWHVKPSHTDNDTGGWLYGSNGIQTYELPDYCNNPTDAWPIIEKYRISFLDQLTEWCVDAKGVSPVFEANPFRGAMIVFLMMQESANVQDNPA